MAKKKLPWIRPNFWVSPNGTQASINFVTELYDSNGKTPIFGCKEDDDSIWLRTGSDPRYPGAPEPSASELAGTLLHEMLHGLYPEGDEAFIERAEQILSATMRRNKKVWYWLLENL